MNENKNILETQKKQIQNLALNVYKYQDFKTSIALEKITAAPYKKNTIMKALSVGRNFIKYGEKDKHMSSLFYKTLKELKDNHYAKLTPSEQDKLVFKSRKLDVKQIEEDRYKKLKEICNQSNSKEESIIENNKVDNKNSQHIQLLKNILIAQNKLIEFLEGV